MNSRLLVTINASYMTINSNFYKNSNNNFPKSVNSRLLVTINASYDYKILIFIRLHVTTRGYLYHSNIVGH